MGLSSTLFYSTNDQLETLFSRISLTRQQVDESRVHKDNLLEQIKPEMSEALGFPVKHWLQGSYKNFTVIRPTRKNEEFDIDVGLYVLCNAKEEGLSASDTKDLLREVLGSFEAYRSEAELGERKNSCERLHYPGIFHIDIPIYYYDETHEVCKLATSDDGWRDSDPKALQDWFNDQIRDLCQRDKSQLRRIIKYLKAWTSLKTQEDEVTIPSVALTVLVVENFDRSDDDDDAFINTASGITDQIGSNGTVQNPVGEGDLLGLKANDLELVRRRLGSLKRVCEYVRGCEDSIEQFVLWSNVFEHFFPPLVERQDAVESNTGLPATTTPPRIRVNHSDKNNKLISSQVRTNITVHKGDSLDFVIENQDDFPDGVHVEWIVRNQGGESSKINDLGHITRGGIAEKSSESCEYRGTHYKECIVMDRHSIKGITAVKVLIQGFPRPERNPPKKKHYKGR